ncbi:MAG: hypothetical protein RIE08_02685 [Acidimicrobiales bacterium]
MTSPDRLGSGPPRSGLAGPPRRVLPAAFATVMVAAVALVGCSGGGADTFGVESAAEDAATLSYVIPEGAGEAFDRGEPLEILPAELDMSVGDVIEIVNEDDRGHLIGPFFVGAGEVLRQRFRSAGEFIGICTVHPSGEIVVTVS